MYDTILFDLDGTLTDPGEGIINSVLYALNKYEIHIEDKTDLYKFIGPPLVDSFKIYFGFSEEKSMQAVEYYREYFKEKGMFENTVCDGIEDLLESLKAADKKLIAATSKPEPFAVKILEHFSLAGYFDFIAGATMNSQRIKKAHIIEYALNCCNINDLSGVVMVGDREHDIIGAKTVGIDSIGVLFGYGSREELVRAGASYIAEKTEDIYKIVI